MMKVHPSIVRLVLGFAGLALLAFGALGGEACTPAQRAAIPSAERDLCVELRAIAPDSAAIQSVCATADQLAPFVPALLEAQAAEAADASPGVKAPSTALIAFSMPAPAKRHAPRRCEPPPLPSCTTIGAEVDYDSGVKDDAGRWHYTGRTVSRPCDAGH